jgi:hypothetical protein
MRWERKRKLADMRGGFQDGLVGGQREGRFFAGLQAHSFVFYSEWACADRSGFTTPLLRSSFGNTEYTPGKLTTGEASRADQNEMQPKDQCLRWLG